MTKRITASLAALSTIVVLVSGCGSNDSPSSAAPAAPATSVAGGTLTGQYTAFPDYLDPALAYTQEAWTALWPAYTGLLTYRHAEGDAGAQLVPGLAESLPTISGDGRRYALRLRDGLTYSDGTAVKASDFEHSIKRVLNLESGGSFFFEGIEGAADYIEAGKARADISGIDTDDATGDITITLAEPDGQFSFYLAMLFSALVPSTTPFENATSEPAPGVGPYELTDVKAGRAFSLKKVRGFEGLPEVPVAKADRIELTVVSNQGRQAEDVINDRVDFLEDAPSADQVRNLRTAAKGRYEEYVTNSTYFFFLNSDVAPFNDERVRQAVATAVDERALARIFGGLLEPGCNFLPPGMAGYEKLDPCPWGDPTQAPDVAKAKQMIADAGAAGEPVTVYADDVPTSSAAGEYLADLLNQIGLDAKPKVVSGDVYFQTVGNQKTKAQAGFANWFQDYAAPANFFQLIDGAVIQPTNNQNFGNVDDPEINEKLAAANRLTDPGKAAGAYAEIDRLLVEKALVLPYGHKRLTKITSSRIAFDEAIYHPVFGLDLTTLALKAE